jgi:hypothetical protein
MRTGKALTALAANFDVVYFDVVSGELRIDEATVSWRRRHLAAYFLLLAAVLGQCLVQPPKVAAALIERDLYAPGDSLITRDTQTGLGWLDLPKASQHWVNDVLDDAGGWLSAGFHYATEQEFLALFSNASLSVHSGYAGVQLQEAGAFQQLLGVTQTSTVSTVPSHIFQWFPGAPTRRGALPVPGRWSGNKPDQGGKHW